MIKSTSMFIAALAFAAAPFLSGCGTAEAPAVAPEATEAAEPAETAETTEASVTIEAPAEDTHEHVDHADEEDMADDAHDHSEDEHADEEDHGHSHEAPRGGALVELGDHVAHFEVLLSAQTGTLTFYAMDGHVETPVRLASEGFPVLVTLDGAAEPIALEMKAVASELTGETVGNTSEFAVTDERLLNQAHFKAVIPAVDIRGVAFENVEFSFPEGNE